MSVRCRLETVITCGALLLLTATSAFAAASKYGRSPGLDNPVLREGDRAAYVAGEVMVKFRTALPLEGAAKTSGQPEIDAIFQKHAVMEIARVSRRPQPQVQPGQVDLTRVYRIQYASGADALDVARELAAHPEIEYAEPRFIYELDLIPNDTSWASQNAYMQKMQFPAAWDNTLGSSGPVVIAICDGGSHWSHTDLAANVWNNADEIPANLIDDDGNGYVDDVRGWNFANNTNDPRGLAATPASADHGTHVAGICTAVANNALGIAGASFNADFMPICVAAPATDNAIAFGYDGIIYAAENDADVVNCSWGGTGSPSAFEQEVIDFAYQNGTVVVCAAGNTGTEVLHFPSAYEHCLAVSNVTNSDLRNTSTTFGLWVDVAAQGTSILSTIDPSGNASLTGTSMSSPHAAAACALVKTRYPGYTPEQVMQRVRVTSDNIDGIQPTAYRGKLGYGRINANQALIKNTPAISVTSSSFTTTDSDGIIEPGETVTVNLGITNWLASCTGIDFKLRENSVHTTMVDSAATLASIDSMETDALPPFTFTVSPTAPIQTTVLFTLFLTTTTPAYTDRSRFELTILPVFATHDANNIDCSVTSVGKLGYALTAGGTGKDGIGLRFNGSTSYLFEGGLMIGTGTATVSDGCRTTGSAQDDDFRTEPNGVPVVQEPSPPFAEYGIATFTDALASSPLGLNVKQESYEMAAAPNDDFILLKYRIRNDSASPRNGLRVGWFCDMDIDGGHFGTNQTGYDAGRGLMYAFDTGTGPDDYVGVVTLSEPGTVSARGIWNDQALAPDWGVYDAYTDQEKWDTISVPGATHVVAGPADVSIGIGTGPFDIAPGDSITVAFAFVGGTNLADLQTNSDAALALYEGLTTDAGDPDVDVAPRALHLAQNVPNPFNPSTTIAFELPRTTKVVLRVYGVNGRLVRTLADGELSSGPHSIRWDGRNDAGVALSSGTYFYRFTADGKTLVRKMQLVK